MRGRPINMYFVYVLISQKDKKYYIGCTHDLVRRVLRHNSGFVKSTKHRVPLQLVYKEEYYTLSEARKRENELKRMKGGIQFRQIIENNSRA